MPESLDQTKQKIESVLRQRARQALVRTLGEAMGGQELQILTALGVDGNEKLLQIFIEEASQLLKKGK